MTEKPHSLYRFGKAFEMDNEKGFGVVDNCVFAGMLVISAVIGLYISYKGSKSPEEFLMGNRSLKPLPVSMSLITSYIQGTTLIVLYLLNLPALTSFPSVLLCM
ncbi:hypothetical protein Avbf_18895 [Armadillidium vulgare]|nr:hypothetical protein Avbf_18895 [Armadillidium vulgare]